MSGLEVSVAVTTTGLDLRLDLAVAPGEVVAVVGPNGAGKTTLLRMVAGLVVPDEGRITLDGEVLVDTALGIHVEPAARHVGVVFQDYLLFDHLSAGDNVAFGPRSRGMGRRRSDAVALEWLERLGLADVASVRPDRLSGGQQQRVALARALAAAPRCLLLDEPMAALDADSRGAIRRTLRRHLTDFGGPVLLVTHEPLEALALADRLVVVEGGRITQQGTPAEVARRPRSPWVAGLVGINLFAGRGPGRRIEVDGGGVVVVPEPAAPGRVLATVHPRHVSLHRTRPSGSPRNVLPGTVGHVEIAGDRVRVEVLTSPPLVAEVTAAALAELRLAEGGPVWASFKAADVEAYPA